MTTLREAAQQALEALEQLQGGCTDHEDGTVEAITVWCPEVITALRAALAEPVQEPVAWMGIDVEGNPNKFRLNFFSGAIPLFTTPEDRSLIATNEKNGSPCPEFWDWLPKAYNFEGLGVFTKYNMEVAFIAGKESVVTSDTSKERVAETPKKVHEQPAQEEPEPVASIYVTLDGDREFDDWRHDLPVGTNLLYTAPPQQPAPEPVAWLLQSELDDLLKCNHRRLGADSPRIWAPFDISSPSPDMGLVAVYTAPPQRKPLAEWQINDLMDDQMAAIDPEDVCSWSFRQGVYAAEKHHGVRT